MIQSGILYTIDSTTGQATNKPLKGAWINFVQNDVIKVRTQTHGETGAYSVDVPFGKYTVNLAVGNVTVTMRAGQLFELKSGDNANAFQNWLYSTTADVDDTLLNSFKQIANDISDSANRAENAVTEAQQIQQQMQNNSIGDANGKWMKEGAHGLAGGNSKNTTDFNIRDLKNYPKGFSWLYGLTNVTGKPSGNGAIFMSKYSDDWSSCLYFRDNGWVYHGSRVRGVDSDWAMLYSEATTKKDKNNVLHATTETPKDTMLVGDFGVGGRGINSVTFNDFYAFPIDNYELTKFPIQTGFYTLSREMRNGWKNNGEAVIYTGQLEVQIRAYRAGDEIILKAWEAGVCYINIRQSGKRWTGWFQDLNGRNATIDSNGNIKKASPIIKLFDDHIESNDQFKEEPVFEKLGIGVYKISNTNGLARGITHGDWYIETPKNRNGLPYFMVEWEQDDITDDVIIKVFDRKFDINIGDFINGEPRDIGKDERWIDLRFHEQIYSLTNELPDINVPYHELWGVDPYIPQVVEQTEEDMALEDQRAF